MPNKVILKYHAFVTLNKLQTNSLKIRIYAKPFFKGQSCHPLKRINRNNKLKMVFNVLFFFPLIKMWKSAIIQWYCSEHFELLEKSYLWNATKITIRKEKEIILEPFLQIKQNPNPHLLCLLTDSCLYILENKLKLETSKEILKKWLNSFLHCTSVDKFLS